jgi:hypothetical protein
MVLNREERPIRQHLSYRKTRLPKPLKGKEETSLLQLPLGPGLLLQVPYKRSHVGRLSAHGVFQCAIN